MMRWSMLLVLVGAVACLRQSRVFEVTRTYTNDRMSQDEKVATLTLIIDSQYEQVIPEVQLVYEVLVESTALRNPSDQVLLKYRQKTADRQQPQQFMETISFDGLLQSEHKEILGVSISQNYEVLAINYSQQKLKSRKEISSAEVQIHRSQPAKEFILKYESAVKPGEQKQQESFFTKYRWYIIGVLVLLFMMSKMDPEAMQQQMAQQQQRN